MVQISIRQVNVDANLDMGDHNVNNTDGLALSSPDNNRARTLTLGNNGSIYIDNKALLGLDYKLTPDCYPSALTLNTLGGIGAIGDGGKVLVVSQGGGGVSLVAASTVGTTTFTGLSDVEHSYIADGFIVSKHNYDGLINTRRVRAQDKFMSITVGSDSVYPTGYNDADFVDTTTSLVLRGQTATHVLGGVVSIQGGWRFPTWTGAHNVAMPATDGTVGQTLRTDGLGNIAWTSGSTATFAGLSDVGTLSANGGKFLKVNAGGTALEYLTIGTIPNIMTDLGDVEGLPTRLTTRAGGGLPVGTDFPVPAILLYDPNYSGGVPQNKRWISGRRFLGSAEGTLTSSPSPETPYFAGDAVLGLIYRQMAAGFGEFANIGPAATSGVIGIGYDIATKLPVPTQLTSFKGVGVTNATTTGVQVSTLAFGTNLTGTYDNATGAMTINAVSGSNNATSLGGIPLSSSSPHTGDILQFTNGQWTPATPTTGGAYSPGNGIAILGGSLSAKLSTANTLLSFNGNGLQSNGVKVVNGGLSGNFQTINLGSGFSLIDNGSGSCTISSLGGGGGSVGGVSIFCSGPAGSTSTTAASTITFLEGSGMTISATDTTVTFNSSGGLSPGTTLTVNADNQSGLTVNNNNGKTGNFGFVSNGNRVGFSATTGEGFGAAGFLASNYQIGMKLQACTTGVSYSDNNGTHANYLPIPFATISASPQNGDMSFTHFYPPGSSTLNVGFRYYWNGSWLPLSQDTVY